MGDECGVCENERFSTLGRRLRCGVVGSAEGTGVAETPP